MAAFVVAQFHRSMVCSVVFKNGQISKLIHFISQPHFHFSLFWGVNVSSEVDFTNWLWLETSYYCTIQKKGRVIIKCWYIVGNIIRNEKMQIFVLLWPPPSMVAFCVCVLLNIV